VRCTVAVRLAAGALSLLSSSAVLSQEPPLRADEHLVRMVLQEAEGEPLDGMIAVAGVALDRARDRRWPDTVREVVYQPAQFQGLSLPDRAWTERAIRRARRAVRRARAGERPCGRVLWYHTVDVRPRWVEELTPVCVIGYHVFWNDPSRL